MNWGTIIGTVAALATPWPTARVLSGLFRRIGVRYDFYFGWGCCGAGGAIGSAVDRQWLHVIAYGLNALAALICWWLSRRKRKRCPVLRPVPGGPHA